MLFFALRMLGFAKTILNFCLTHWKIFLPLLIIVVEFFVVSNIYYNKGVAEEKAKWEERIKIETEKNAKLTASIASAVDNYGTLADRQDEARVEREVVHENNIRTIIQEKPVYKECIVDDDVIDELNALRSIAR